MWNNTIQFTGNIWDGIKLALVAAHTSIKGWFTDTDWSGLWDNTLEFSGDIWSGIKTALDTAWTNLKEWHTTVDWDTVAESIGTAIRTAFIGVFKFGTWLAKGIGDGIAFAATAITSGDTDWSAVFQGLKDAVLGLAGFIGKIILAAFGIKWSDVEAKWDEFITGLKEWFGNVSFSGVWDGLLDALKSIGPSIKSYLMSLMPSFADLKSKVTNVGSAIGDKAAAAKESVVGTVGNVKDTVAGWFGMNEGGAISGDGSGTSDSIPAMLSDGEFVINAKSTKLFGPLLEALNGQKFAKGGRVGAMKQVQNYAAGGTVSDAKSYQFLQFEEGLFSMSATIDKFIGNMDATDPAVNKVVRQLEYLQKHTGNLNEDQVLAHDYATRINQAMIDLLPKKKREAEVTSEAAGAVKDLGDSAKKASDSVAQVKNEWEGTAQSFTGPIKQALANGGDIGDAFKQGLKGMLQRISSKLLDKAFAPLEKGIDDFLNNMMSSSSNLGGMFGGGGGGGGGFLSSLLGGGGGPRTAGGLFGGLMMARGGIVPELGMQPQYFAHGGMARGTDTVPAMLTPGEMVLTKEQQQMMMGGQQKAGDTYNFNIEATDANSFKRMLSSDPKFLSNVAEQGKKATSGLRRAR